MSVKQLDSIEKAVDIILTDNKQEETAPIEEAYSHDVLNGLVASVENKGLTREDKLALWTVIRNYADAAIRNYMQV